MPELDDEMGLVQNYWRDKKARVEASSDASGLGFQDPRGQPGIGLGQNDEPSSSSFMDWLAEKRGQDGTSMAGAPGWVQAIHGIGSGLEAFSAGVQGRTPMFMQQQQLVH